jgi:hypothetical protein
MSHVPRLSEAIRSEATLLAMTVRNALEGTLHGGELGDLSLTDEQMAILNRVVRDAAATALHAKAHYLTSNAARQYLDFQAMLVPGYWEPPELLDDYVESWASDPGPRDDIRCRGCGRAVVDLGDRWSHINAECGLNVGCCRAASFTPDDGWDEKIPRGWQAAPNR